MQKTKEQNKLDAAKKGSKRIFNDHFKQSKSSRSGR